MPNINSFFGIRNMLPKRELPIGSLSSAVDVDIDDAGSISVRRGYSLSKPVSVQLSYSTDDGRGLIISDGILYRVMPDMTLIKVSECSATNFSDNGKFVFANDGLMILPDNTARNISIPSPTLPPVISIVSGEMPAGFYSVVYCNVIDGIEGGCSPVATIELDGRQGIFIEGMTADNNVYVTDAGGTVFYDSKGSRLNELQLSTSGYPFGAEIIEYHESKLFVSVFNGNGTTTLFFSKPFYYHLYDLSADYLVIPGHILSMESTGFGLVICTDAEILLFTNEGLLQTLASYGVVPGNSIAKKSDGTIVINTKRGICTALPFTNLTETKALFPVGEKCMTEVVDQDGIQKFIVLTDGSGTAYTTNY